MEVSDSYRTLMTDFDAVMRAYDAENGGPAKPDNLYLVNEVMREKHSSLFAVDTQDGCTHHFRINPVYERIQEWRKIFLRAGVQPQDIAEVCMSEMPEPLKAYDGQFYLMANNVTEEQFKLVTELRIHTDGKVMHKDDYICPWTHDEFWRANGVERSILTQLRAIHRIQEVMVDELKKVISDNGKLLAKTGSILFDCETVFNNDDDSRTIEELIRDHCFEEAGSRLFAFDQMGTGPCPDEEGNEPTDEDYDEHFDSLYDAADHWLDTPEEWTAHCDAEREKYIKAHPEQKNGCVDCQAEEDERRRVA